MNSGASIAEITKLGQSLGITRLADITGLDVVGLPVVQAVRPFSLSNAVSQGKGSTLEAAALSAVFESAESFAAERTDLYETVFTSAHALEVPVQKYALHLLRGVAADWPERSLRWIAAKNLRTDRQVMVPFELVHTAYTLPEAVGDGVFSGATTGLSAAFKADDATSHGLLECIERDAIARANGIHGFFQRRRIDPNTIGNSVVCNVLEELARRGFLVGLWHAESMAGAPVIWCHIMEACEPRLALMPFPGEGTAARFDSVSAVLSAIYEAAQSRLTAISGARDDFSRRHYPKYPDWQMLAAHQRLIAQGPREVHFDAVDGGASLDINGLVNNLETGGHLDVLEVQLDHAAVPEEIVVRKIIVPSLLPLVEG
jgi:YcaO-like protein with predicted kinase domain